jgi:hypothetical protein
MREPAQTPAASPAFAPLPQFASAAAHNAQAAMNIYQLALAQAREQVEQKRFEREISRWN